MSFDAVPTSVSVGELAEVTLVLANTAPAVLLLNASIKRHADQTGVWRVDGDGLSFVPVRVGLASLEGQVQVLDGVKAGDTVVAYSEKELTANSRIKIVDALAQPKP